MKIDKQKRIPIRLAYAIARMTPWFKSDDTVEKDAEDLRCRKAELSWGRFQKSCWFVKSADVEAATRTQRMKSGTFSL
jgi:hypothetical protein